MLLTFPLIGKWRPGQVRITWREQSSRKIVPEVEQIIEETWQLALKRPNINLFDGPMCRLEAMQITQDSLELTLSPTSFRIFMGTNLSNARLADEFTHQILANSVGLSVILISSDEQLMLGRRNGRVAYYPNRLHPFSGCLEPGPSVDLFDNIRRELTEELSLQAADIPELVCTGMTEDFSLRQPEFCFAARSSKSAAQIESHLDPAEHTAVWKMPVDRRAIESVLQTEEQLTPVAVGAMLLWGRTMYGEEWFRAHGPADPR